MNSRRSGWLDLALGWFSEIESPAFKKGWLSWLAYACLIGTCHDLPAQTSTTQLRKDASACQLAAAVISTATYQAPSLVNTLVTGQFLRARTGESDPIRIFTSGDAMERTEITTPNGVATRILNAGHARFHDANDVTKDLSAVNTFHERVMINPALSLLTECATPNTQAVDAGLTSSAGGTYHEIDLAWTFNPASASVSDQLRLSKTKFLIEPSTMTVAEIDEDRFSENDSTLPFHYRTVYSDYRTDQGRLIPHTVQTYINEKLRYTVSITSYAEASQADPSEFNLGGLN